jgi:hypothetical protein
MSTETELAGTPAEVTTPETKTETPVNNGFVNLDDEAPEGESEETEGEKPEDKAKTEEPAKKDGEEAEAKKKLSGAQRAKLREARLLNENAELQRRLEEAERRKEPAAAAGDSDKPPREEDFPDWFAWQRALTAYEAGKSARDAIKSEFQTREESERSLKQAQAARERAEAHAERVEQARETIADFDEVMAEMKGVNVRNDVLEEIMSSDKSALLAYHFAQNPNELDALNSMSRTELARAMGRLEATVKLPEAKRATSAPAPLSRPRGGASPSSQEADLEAYLNKTYGKRR